MIHTLQEIILEAVDRLWHQVRAGLPATVAAVIIMLGALAAARLARWAVRRAVTRLDLDARLRRAGLSTMLDPGGRIRVSRLLSEGVFWSFLVAGLLAALNALGTQTGAFVVDGLVSVLPRLAGGALIVLAGMWLSLYLGRSALIWAVNEDLPSPRKISWAVRTLVMFAAAVTAADTMHFAGSLFRAAFIIVLAGIVLAASLALGLGTRDMVRRHVEDRFARDRACTGEGSAWHHL